MRYEWRQRETTAEITVTNARWEPNAPEIPVGARTSLTKDRYIVAAAGRTGLSRRTVSTQVAGADP